MNLTGCEIRFVLFGPDGRVTRSLANILLLYPG
jgi:hypothetical protein